MVRWQKQVFIHTRLSHAYLALARLSCHSLYASSFGITCPTNLVCSIFGKQIQYCLIVGFLSVGWDIGLCVRDMCRRCTELRLEQMQPSLRWIFNLLVFTIHLILQAVCMPLYRRVIECTLCLLLCHWVTMFCVCRALMLLLLTVAVDHCRWTCDVSVLTDWCTLIIVGTVDVYITAPTAGEKCCVDTHTVDQSDTSTRSPWATAVSLPVSRLNSGWSSTATRPSHPDILRSFTFHQRRRQVFQRMTIAEVGAIIHQPSAYWHTTAPRGINIVTDQPHGRSYARRLFSFYPRDAMLARVIVIADTAKVTISD